LWKDAASIAKKLVNGHHLSQNQAKMIAVVFYNAREFELAKRVVNLFESKNKPARGLASSDSFTQIKEKLRGK